MNQENISFIRLLTSTETLAQNYQNLDDMLERKQMKERLVVYVFNLQQKMRELESNQNGTLFDDERFFGYTTRIQNLEKIINEILKTKHHASITQEEAEDDKSLREVTPSQLISDDTSDHSSVCSDSCSDDEDDDESEEEEVDSKEIIKTEENEEKEFINTISSLHSNKIGIEEQRKIMEVNENEKHELLDGLVDMASILKGEATSINSHLIDQNQQLSKLSEKAESTSTQLGGEVKNLNNHFRKQIVSSCGGIVHVLFIVIVFFIVTMFMRLLPRRFSYLSLIKA
mmetsp:Transcript_25516/g.33217  ORF Transcript_25516/g.33217 Transcript_25516/m.33217 type:complete len:286 (-) Transcript_25516:255-1112(-)